MLFQAFFLNKKKDFNLFVVLFFCIQGPTRGLI
jgi:hypothetical protein